MEFWRTPKRDFSRRLLGFTAIALLVFSLSNVRGQLADQLSSYVGAGKQAPNVKASLAADKLAARPGDSLHLVVTLDHAEGWNSYWINPGIGAPTKFSWTLPEGFAAGEPLWPIPKVKKTPYGNNHIYTNKVDIIIPLTIATTAVKGLAPIVLDLEWLACDDKGCVPGGSKLTAQLNVGDQSVDDPAAQAKVALVKAMQPQQSNAWEVTSAIKGGRFTISLTPREGANPNPGEIYFFEASESPQLKSETIQVSVEGGAGANLKSLLGTPAKRTVSLAKGDEEIAGPIQGYLYAPNGWLSDGTVKALSISATGEVHSGSAEAARQATGNKAEVKSASAEEIAAGAELYDAEARPDYVLLYGTEKKLTLLPALALIFLGGMILNLMPCVFPVLAIKILGFVGHAGEDAAKVKKHSVFYALGVVASMWVLSAVIISLNLNWGAQMQNPMFVASIIIVMFLLGLNMAGVFELGTSLTGVGGKLQTKSGYSGSFFTGILTTVVATPCSGPFLGAVMAYALSQTKWVAFVVFTFFGLGIALPYVALSFFPRLLDKLPQPGAWMEVLKKGMSFALFATAVFFLNSFAHQTGFSGVSWLLFALVVLGLAGWIYGTWGTPFQTPRQRYIVGYGLALLTAFSALQMARIGAAKTPPRFVIEGDWKPWYPGVMEVNRAKKRIAWVDYTADWCLTCKLNEGRVFSDKRVLEKLQELDVELIQADNTKHRPEIDADLQRFNRSNLPVNIIVPANPNQPYIILPELISPRDALYALEKASASPSAEVTKN